MTTPMMQQHREAKERHPGMILLFRAGDFYELFYEDAEIVSRVLNIALTSRDGKVPMAGFPHQALETHLRRLLSAGHRVAVCDQVEEASQAKGRIIRREVTRVVTPGTLTDATRRDWNFDPANAKGALFGHFQVSTLAGFGFDDDSPCVAAAGALLLYLQETTRTALPHLRRLRPHAEGKYLFLDEVTRRSLELTRTLRDNSRDGSLLSVI